MCLGHLTLSDSEIRKASTKILLKTEAVFTALLQTLQRAFKGLHVYPDS